MITVRHQIELETFFLISIAAGISVFFVIQKNNYQPQFSIASGIPSVSVPAEVISPKVIISSQISPDGTKKVIMKITENPDNTKTYDFSVSDENGANEQFIFAKTLSSSNNMVIPFNTWSPDDKYFFIEQNAGGNKSVFVFKATGALFTDTETYLDAADSFIQKNTGNNFDEATGWASETLVIINTKKSDNTKGPSYWFEVPSKAIIQLSTEF
jgi:hypothetical protein